MKFADHFYLKKRNLKGEKVDENYDYDISIKQALDPFPELHVDMVSELSSY